MLRNTRLLYSAFAIAFILMIASAYWIIRGVVDESARVESLTRDTVIGLTAQTSQELYSLIDTLYRLQNSDEDVSVSELNNRFDIMWSRIETNSSGPVGDVIRGVENARKAMDTFQSVLQSTEQEIVRLDPNDQETITKLLEEYRGLLPVLNEMRQAMVFESSKASVSFFNRIQQIDLWAKILLPSMLLSGAIVALIFYRDRKSLNSLASTLERRVEERTTELRQSNEALLGEIQERKSVEQKLIQAQKMEVVGQLTGGIAHDFNNLLAIIQGNAELLEAKSTPEIERFLKPVLRAAQRGSELTQRLLAFSRQQPLNPASVDLYALSKGLTILLQRALGADTEVTVDVDDELWLALADPGQVENALLNLAINADHAMPKGGQLYIKLRNRHLSEEEVEENPDAIPGDYVLLSIQDTGSGMDEETLRHAFEPFFTTKEVGKGSGLGLSMVYGFVRQSGGHIDIESTVGFGTTVNIYLPRALGSQQANDVLGHAPLERLSGGGETVLIIEDDPDVMQFTSATLENLKYQVLTAQDRDQVTRILNSDEEIDAILSDIVISGAVIGPDFFEPFGDRLKDVSVVYMTGYSVGSSSRTKHLENHPFIVNKPFKRKDLALQLRKAIEQKFL